MNKPSYAKRRKAWLWAKAQIEKRLSPIVKADKAWRLSPADERIPIRANVAEDIDFIDIKDDDEFRLP